MVSGALRQRLFQSKMPRFETGSCNGEHAVAKIDSVEKLKEHYMAPTEEVIKKVMPTLDEFSRRFIDHSPFYLIASYSDYGVDVTPRGDPPGAVKMPDDKTILMADRPGNNRLDTLENIIRNAEIALLFLVPGLSETLRINGTAEVVIGDELKLLEERGQLPKSAIKVTVREAYFQCAKALNRGKLWDPQAHVDRKDFPLLRKVIAKQIANAEAGATQDGTQSSSEHRWWE